MRDKLFQEILDETPEETKIFVRLYADLVKRISNILDEKGYSQASLAQSLDKRPSEIHKWLNGEHNFTLKSIAKLQAELEEPLLVVPKTKIMRSFEKSPDSEWHKPLLTDSKIWPDGEDEKIAA